MNFDGQGRAYHDPQMSVSIFSSGLPLTSRCRPHKRSQQTASFTFHDNGNHEWGQQSSDVTCHC